MKNEIDKIYSWPDNILVGLSYEASRVSEVVKIKLALMRRCLGFPCINLKSALSA